MIVGYSDYDCPTDGMGPFKELFEYSRNLRYQTSLTGLDAVLLWGGSDISPSLYKQERIPNSGPTQPSERDVFEWEIIKEAEKNKIPIIGVCRGAQILCAYAGGKLIQDVNNHQHNHDITTVDGKHFLVNSHHHQMLYPYEVDHELLAWTSKHQATSYKPESFKGSLALEKRLVKEPEVVYFPKIKGIGVQCHPEWHRKDHPFNEWLLQTINNKFFM